MASSGKTRVLFLNSCVHGGGAGNSLHMYLQAEHERIDAHVVLPEPGILEGRIKDYATFHYMPEFVERIERSPYGFLKGVKFMHVHLVANLYALSRSVQRIAKIVREIQPDVIYCNHMLAEPVGVAVGKLTNKPVILHARNIHVTGWGYWFYQLLARQKVVKGILSNSVCTSLIYQELCPEKVQVLHNFIDVDEFQKGFGGAQLRQEFGIPQDRTIFGYMGRLVPWKGVDSLLEGFSQVARSHPKAHLCILGGTDSGMHTDLGLKYRKMAEEFGITSQVTFVPFREDIRPYLAEFDALVLPSLQPEPFGRVLIEAMCFGVPSIVPAQGGAAEVIQHEKNGLWFAPRDAADMAKQMNRFMTNPEERKRMGAFGQERVRELYDAKRQAPHITRVIEAVASGQKVSEIPQNLDASVFAMAKEIAA